jgi:hypothetical protein
MESNPLSLTTRREFKISLVESTMNAKRLLALLTALAMIFGSSCFAVLWMGAVGRVSEWTGLPQYESQIPKLQWYGTLWESLGIAFLFIASGVTSIRPMRVT